MSVQRGSPWLDRADGARDRAGASAAQAWREPVRWCLASYFIEIKCQHPPISFFSTSAVHTQGTPHKTQGWWDMVPPCL